MTLNCLYVPLGCNKLGGHQYTWADHPHVGILDISQLLHTLQSFVSQTHIYRLTHLHIHTHSSLMSCNNITAVQHSTFSKHKLTQILSHYHPTLFPHCGVRTHSHCWSYHREHDSSSVRLAPLTRWCAVGPKVSNKKLFSSRDLK